MDVTAPRPLKRVILSCRGVLGMSQGELADALGISRRTIIRWTRGHTAPVPVQVQQLADLVREEDDDLADELLAAAGVEVPPRPEEQPRSPVMVAVAPVTEPAPPLQPLPPAPAHAIDAIVCVAADAANLVPRAMRPAIRAAFARARELGLAIDQVVRGMDGAG